MPRKGSSGIKYLLKKHAPTCANRGRLTDCACAWYTKYGEHLVQLEKWAGQQVDPYSTKGAAVVHRRLLVAIDEKRFDADGEQVTGSDRLFSWYIGEWRTHYAQEYGLVANSLTDMLNVIDFGGKPKGSGSGLGRYTLDELAEGSTIIERWLNKTAKTRNWSDNTLNRYYELLSTLCVQATKWKDGSKPRMTKNPMFFIAKRVGIEKKFTDRPLVEDVEDRLFEAAKLLNRPVQPASTRGRLTQEQADQIRARVKRGKETKVQIAKAFKVSPQTVIGIAKGETWNPANHKISTKGTEMTGRLIGGFDGGLRVTEMLKVELPNVERPIKLRVKDGDLLEVVPIKLMPEITKGGKTTGKIEYVYAATARFKRFLQVRAFELKNNPKGRQFIWGKVNGRPVKGFRRPAKELFALAGLEWGRNNGIVWHTTRHEFVSRLVEKYGIEIGQELARHADSKTTQGYAHNRKEHVLAAAVGLDRGK